MVEVAGELDMMTSPQLRDTLQRLLDAGTRNVVIDLARARRVRPPVAPDRAPAETARAEDDIERALTSWQVEAALAELDEEHRRVLVEVHWRGRPYAEVADELGIPAGTVKSRVYYGLRALRGALEAQGWRDA